MTIAAILRSVLALFAGAVAASALIGLVEALGQRIYPLPAGVDPSNAESLRAAAANVPTGALLIVLLGWALGSAAGGWLAARIASRSPRLHGLALGLPLTAAGISNMLAIPHPPWFLFLGLLVFMPSALGGAGAASRGLEEAVAPGGDDARGEAGRHSEGDSGGDAAEAGEKSPAEDALNGM